MGATVRPAVKKAVTIMIVDDHKLFTAGLSAILQLIDRDVEIEECSCGRQALSRLDTTVCADLLIVDLDMPT